MIRRLCTTLAVCALAVAAMLFASPYVSAAPGAGPPILVSQISILSALTDPALPAVDQVATAARLDQLVASCNGGSALRPSSTGVRLVVTLDPLSAASIIGGASRPAMWPPIAA